MTASLVEEINEEANRGDFQLLQGEMTEMCRQTLAPVAFRVTSTDTQLRQSPTFGTFIFATMDEDALNREILDCCRYGEREELQEYLKEASTQFTHQ